MEDGDRIEEGSSRLLPGSSVTGSSNDYRWVDGSEVDSELPPWSLFEDRDSVEASGSIRRRLIKKPKRVDSFDVEAMEIAGANPHHLKDVSMWQTIAIAFQTLGVVYGDMGTSPLYVFADVFTKVHIEEDVDVLGALSLVIYTIALIPLAKYVFVVLRANDNGEGGTFALYSLICRYAKVNLLPNRQPADEHISSFKLKLPTPELERALNIKEILEKRSSLKTLILLLVLMGTSMVIGDGILTPAISVMSAVSGLQGQIKSFDTNAVVIVSIIILVALFSIQKFGTGKVGFLFAPVLALWFFSLGSIGIYNVVKYDLTVVRALNPTYIYLFFKKNSNNAWSALGGCVLCVTGAEAMFADLGHFTVPAIQIAFTFVVFPCLLLAYMGQAAYLMKHPDSAARIFYDSVPASLFWPVFVTATLAAMIASQAMISATFSCVKQSMALGCFPRMKIVHTSKRRMGQIYIPVINWFLMIMCIFVVAIFQRTTDIANAYGIAEVGVMLVSTVLVTLVMLLIWQTNLFLALCFPLVFGSVFRYIFLNRHFSNSNSLVNGSTAPSKDDYFAAIHHISHIVRRDFYMERTLNKLRISNLNSELVFRVLRACSNSGTESFRFFNWACSHNPSYQPTTLEFEELVKTLARTRKYTTMWKVLLQMKTQNLKISPETISFIIQEYGKQGLVDNAVTIFNQCSKSIDCPQTVEVYNALLFALCEVKMFHGAYALIRRMIRKGVTPDKKTYGTLVTGWCSAGKMKEAQEFLEEMSQKGFNPPLRGRDLLVEGLLNAGYLESAKDMVRKMTKEGSVPDIGTFNSLIDVICNSGEVDFCINIFHEVCKLGLCPDINTYKILIPATSKVGRIDEAFRLLHCCIEDGHVPFPSLYGPILKGMCKRGQFDDAFCFFGDMKHKGHPPNRPVYTMLITMCGRGGRFVDAANYLMEMAELGLPPISRCFDMVTDGLKNCGKHDLAKKIEQLEVSIRGI